MGLQLEERHDVRQYFQVEVQPKPNGESEAINPQSNYSKCFDDDGRMKRTGMLLYLSPCMYNNTTHSML